MAEQHLGLAEEQHAAVAEREVEAGQYPRLVRLLLSGFTDLPALQRAVEHGHVHAYVLKPVDSQRLLAAIDQAHRVRDGAPFVPPEGETP